MTRLPEFFAQLLSVLAGLLLVVMTSAFILLPYSMSANPGTAPSRITTSDHPG